MSQFRLARISLLLAAIGLNAAPALLTSAHAQAAKPAAAEAPKENVRPEIFKLIDPAVIQPLLNAKNYTEVQSRISQAEAIANRTPFENYIIDRMKVQLGSGTNNVAMTTAALEASIASGRLTPAEEADFTQVLGSYAYTAKNYTKAIEYYKRYQKISPTPLKVRDLLIRSHYLNGDYASASAELLPVVTEIEKAGKIPEKEDLSLLASSYGKLKQMPAYFGVLEKLAQYYPTDEYWTDLLNNVQRKPGFNNRHQLDIYRLESAAIKTMAPEEYTEMAELALIAGFPTEAKKALDAGFAAGVLGTGANGAKHKQLRDKANKGAADDAKNIASGEASAAKGKDGTGLVNLGYAYVTMDQFDKGIEFIKQGIAKGMGKKADEAQLHLGVAYAKAGRKDEAIKVFEGLKGGDGMSDIAKYWIMVLNRPAGGATATAAAPAGAPK